MQFFTNKKLQYFSLIVAISSNLFAGTSGKISGTISDKNGDPLIGCNIIVDQLGLGASTDIKGNYYIVNVPAGQYTISATMIGYKTIKIKELSISSDFTTTLDLSMQVEAVEGETVVVTANKDKVVKDLTSSTSVISSDDFESLPITEISEILEIQAGYVDGHMRGGRSGEISYMIDGITITDVYDGNASISVNKNSIEEMQVISGAFNAEYGHAMSGIVNIITKEGSNQTSGNFSTYMGDFASKNSSLFLNIDNIDPLSTKNVDLSMNGPILKDKLFYFTNFRSIRYEGPYSGQKIYNYHNV